MKEIWKNVKEFEGIYQISNLGRVKSIERQGNYNRNHILIGGKDSKGYKIVSLRKNKKGFTKKIHRLVAEAFIPNFNNLPQVNHIDGNKLNNTVQNLEWCDNTYNFYHSVENKLRENSFKALINANKKRRKKVVQYDINGNFIKIYDSIISAQKETNIYHISDCCLNKLKTAGGYIWKYS